MSYIPELSVSLQEPPGKEQKKINICRPFVNLIDNKVTDSFQFRVAHQTTKENSNGDVLDTCTRRNLTGVNKLHERGLKTR
jgi:hypothetical protein